MSDGLRRRVASCGQYNRQAVWVGAGLVWLCVGFELDAVDGAGQGGRLEFGTPPALEWQADAVTGDLPARITVDPAICFGKPTIRGHRLWVSLILGHLAEGWTVDAVLVEFPQLEVDDVRACIAYGARLADVRFAEFAASFRRALDYLSKTLTRVRFESYGSLRPTQFERVVQRVLRA